MNFRGIARTVLVMAMALAVSGSAWAQYGGGGGGMGGGGGTYNPGSRSYGNGAKIGAAVGGAAGAGLLIYALHRRHHAQVAGCVAPDGKSLKTDSGKKTFQLAGEPVSPGEHVSVLGKKTKDSSGIDQLEVSSVTKHMGQCEQSTAMAGTPQN